MSGSNEYGERKLLRAEVQHKNLSGWGRVRNRNYQRCEHKDI